MKKYVFSGFFLTAFLLLVIFFPVNSDAQSQVQDQNRFSGIRANITELVNSGEIPSLSVAVARGGKIIWEEGFGWADRERMIKATPHTMYSLASISKPITATGLMILVEREMVDIHKPVDTYIAPAKITAFEGRAEDATVKHFLNHTAGLPLHYTFFYEDEPYRKPSMDESIRRYGILVHPPGEVYQYANFGFGILDNVITKISGKSFADFMRNEVFLPLGLTHTSVNIGPGLEEYAATRYDDDNNPIPFYDFDHPGASALFSSAHDLVRFGMFHLKDHMADQKPILKDETIDMMHDERDRNAANRSYGLGWAFNRDDNGYRSVSHSGGMPGVSTLLKLIPSEDVAVVVLCNASTRHTRRITDDIIGELLPEFAEKRAKSAERSEPPPYKPVPELIGEWSGAIRTYEGEIPVTMVFQEDGDIHFEIEGQPRTLVNDISYRNKHLTGLMMGDIPTADAQIHDHNVSIDVYLEGDRLVGYVSARSSTKRLYWALSSYIRLVKSK